MPSTHWRDGVTHRPRPWLLAAQQLDLTDNGFRRVPKLDMMPKLELLAMAWNGVKVLTNVERLPRLTVRCARWHASAAIRMWLY